MWCRKKCCSTWFHVPLRWQVDVVCPRKLERCSSCVLPCTSGGHQTESPLKDCTVVPPVFDAPTSLPQFPVSPCPQFPISRLQFPVPSSLSLPCPQFPASQFPVPGSELVVMQPIKLLTRVLGVGAEQGSSSLECVHFDHLSRIEWNVTRSG